MNIIDHCGNVMLFKPVINQQILKTVNVSILEIIFETADINLPKAYKLRKRFAYQICSS